ncbi:SRPBCC family protein [Bacillus sp. NTK034]|uniref:SRPBCC family protein n=1 Tax=Bacillus sp. NTK034 TaxID=2802176 RepID=UPI001A8F617E|nr:SRPBCC family protein [Bacillus sp. NTK034]MBN8202206.1 SRPBCC family protein [Bacillus sp. NTK034]
MDTQITSKIKINKPANVVFEAIVDPAKIGHFWFSSSSERWEQGKSIIVKYDEYNAEGILNVLEIEESKKIVFSWGGETNEETIVAITLNEPDHLSTIIEVNESGLDENDPEAVSKMLGQKEGWIYMLTCLKGYLEHGISDLRASLIH